MQLKMRLALYAVLLFSICGNINGEENGIISEFVDAFTSLVFSEPAHSLVFNENDDNLMEESENDNAFTEEEIDSFRFMMRFFYGLKGTDFGEILEHGKLPKDMGLPEGTTINSIISDLEEDEELERIITDKLSKGFAEILEQQYGNNVMDESSFDKQEAFEEENRFKTPGNRQEEGWEGCRRDYDALALPFTNSITQRVARIIIERIRPVDDCVRVCNEICIRYLEPGFCATACNERIGACQNNDTVDGAIELVLNYVFPIMNVSRWNWAMVDAMGKIPPGISLGQLHWGGSYQKCVDISVNYTYNGSDVFEIRQFTGQFYRLAFQPEPFVNGTLNLLFATCVPSTCSKDNIVEYLTEENFLFKVLLNRVLKWTINEAKMFSGSYTINSTDESLLALCLFFVILFVILNVIAFNYDVNCREGVMESRLAKMKLSFSSNNAARQIQRFPSQISNSDNAPAGYANPTYSDDKLADWDLPGGYHPVNRDDYRRFSVSSDNAYSNMNNNNRTGEKPTLARSISAQSALSTKPLFDDDNNSGKSLADEPPTIWERLEVAFVGFSTYSNLHRLTRTRRPEGYIPTLDSVRFLSLCWAFLGFTWLLGPVVAEAWVSGNLVWALKKYPRKFIFQPIINFHFCSDSYFLISGILVAYHWLRRYGPDKEKMTWKSVVFFYLHKYWRIMPGLAMTMLFFTATYKYLSGGPFGSVRVSDAEYCRHNWWTDLLLIHNLVNVDTLCLAWTFAIPILYQMILVSPLILIPLVKKPILGYAILGGMYAIHIAATAGVSADIQSRDPLDISGWFREYFFTPWCRIGPYLIGMAFGIYLQKNNLKLKVPKFIVPIGWIVALLLIITVQYVTYKQFKEGGSRFTESELVAYNTLARSAWAIGVGWIILACTTGNGGFLGEVLNWKAFQPLSRMNYSVILFYAMLIYSHAYSVQSPIIITTKRITHMFLSNLVMGHLVGVFFVATVFHYPLSLGLERAFTVKTKLDCIKAGKHPPIPEFLEGKSIENEGSGNVYQKLNKPASQSYMFNAISRLDSIDEGYEATVKEYAHPPGINRQHSVTSL